MGQVGTLATSAFKVADTLYQMTLDAKEELQLEDVWYGPQELLPIFPCLIVEPRPKRRRLNGTHRWDISFQVALLLYHGKIQDLQLTRRENEEQAELLEAFLHRDLTLGGTVILGYVTSSEPGAVARGNVMLAATRLTWEGDSREEF